MKKLCLIVLEQNLATQLKIGAYYKNKGFIVHFIVADRLNCFSIEESEIKKTFKFFGFENNYTLLKSAEIKLAENWNGKILKEDVNWDNLYALEKKYLKDIGIQRLARCDYAITNDYYDHYIHPFPNDFNLRMKYVEECILEVISVIEKLKGYDFISLTDTGLKPVLIHLISKCYKSKSFSLASTRIADKWMLFDSYTIGPTSDMEKWMNEVSDNDALLALKEIRSKLDLGEQIYPSHSETIKLSKQSDLKALINYYFWVLKHFLVLKIKKRNVNHEVFKLFFPSLKTSIMYITENFLRKKFYDRNKLLNSSLVKGKKYLYYSLHAMPENHTVLHNANLDELELIKNILLKLPVSYLLVVKLPPKMRLITGGFSKKNKFFKDLLRLNRVVILNPNTSSIDIIRNSQGVVCIGGTALLEAKIFGRPAYRIGYPEFACINSIKDVNEIKGLIYPDESNENLDAGKYIKSCLTHSVSYDPKIAYPIYNSYFSKFESSEQDVLKHDLMVDELCKYFDIRLDV